MSKNPRLETILQRVIVDLRNAITDLAITENEWYLALKFLTDVAQHEEMILVSDVLGFSVLIDNLNHHAEGDATESSVVGPVLARSPPSSETRRRSARQANPVSR